MISSLVSLTFLHLLFHVSNPLYTFLLFIFTLEYRMSLSHSFLRAFFRLFLFSICQSSPSITPFPLSLIMNMVRIRRIMEMRKELKAPPLLPPKLNRSAIEPVDKTVRDIVTFHFQLRKTVLSFSQSLVLSIQESESGGRDGPWKQTVLSDYFVLNDNDVTHLPSLFSIQFEFEIVQPMKIELCMGEVDSLLSIAATIFTLSQVITNRTLSIPLKDVEGESMAILDISCTVKWPPPPVLVQLELRDLYKKYICDSGMLNVIVEESSEGKEVHRSEGQRSGSRVVWRPFTLYLNDHNDVIIISILYRDEKNKTEIIIGEWTSSVNQLERDSVEGRICQLIRRNETKETRRVNGLLEATRVTPLPIDSFLHMITTGTSFHLSFAIDFSSSFDELSPSLSSDAHFVLSSIGDCVEEYTGKSLSALGFGARLPPMDRESQQFCLGLDTNPYCESIQGVLECLDRSMERVNPSKTAHLSHVIYYVSKLAIHANLRRSRDNTQYFILVILTRGIIDDLKEAVQAVIFASKAPISIIFIGMGDKKKEELERLGNGGMRISFQGRRVTRDILTFVDLNEIPVRSVDSWEDRNNLSELALSRVSSQMNTYLSKIPSTSRTSMRSRVFGSMTSVESDDVDEDERKSRMEHYRVAINDEKEEERRGRKAHEKGTQRSMSCISRNVRSMSIANDHRASTMSNDFPTF